MPREHINCHECPHQKLSCFREFSGEELNFLEDFKQGELTLDTNTPILLEETNSPHLYTVLEGWAFRYKSLPNGRRQILNYALPGDLLGLQASVFDVTSHGVETLSPIRLCVFSRDQLWTLYQRFPSLAYDITWLAAREECLLDEHLLSVGQRTALERVAYVIWHLFRRAKEVGMARGSTLEFPLKQQHLADTLGLSLVHTNKTLRRLRASGCLTWQGRKLVVEDLERLRELASADAADMPRRPYI